MTHYDNVRIKYGESNRKNVSASSFHAGTVDFVFSFQLFIPGRQSRLRSFDLSALLCCFRKFNEINPVRFGGSRGEYGYKVSLRSTDTSYVRIKYYRKGTRTCQCPENVLECMQRRRIGTDVVSQSAWRAITTWPTQVWCNIYAKLHGPRSVWWNKELWMMRK